MGQDDYLPSFDAANTISKPLPFISTSWNWVFNTFTLLLQHARVLIKSLVGLTIDTPEKLFFSLICATTVAQMLHKFLEHWDAPEIILQQVLEATSFLMLFHPYVSRPQLDILYHCWWSWAELNKPHPLSNSEISDRFHVKGNLAYPSNALLLVCFPVDFVVVVIFFWRNIWFGGKSHVMAFGREGNDHQEWETENWKSW